MIKVPTVLVLGAGASQHVGYPLGSELMNQICSPSNQEYFVNMVPGKFSREDVRAFIDQFSRAGYSSIDAFLTDYPDYMELGKLVIAKQLKQYEVPDRLFPPHDPGWYLRLFNSLRIEGKISFRGSKVGIVTFNYDRSLEAYLYNALTQGHKADHRRAMNLIRGLHIVHVHGILGPFPSVPYNADQTTYRLPMIASGIKVISEFNDQTNGFCSPEFEKANVLLRNAQRIYFLGFGFHDDNLRRLGLGPDLLSGKEVRATLLGLGSMDLKLKLERLTALGFPRDGWTYPGSCHQFFSNFAALD